MKKSKFLKTLLAAGLAVVVAFDELFAPPEHAANVVTASPAASKVFKNFDFFILKSPFCFYL